MSKAAVVKEHIGLLEILTNPASKKLKKEAGEQSAELAKILKPVKKSKARCKKGGAVPDIFAQVAEIQPLLNSLGMNRPNIVEYGDESATALNAALTEDRTKLSELLASFNKTVSAEGATQKDIVDSQDFIDKIPKSHEQENASRIAYAQTEARNKKVKSTLAGLTTESDCSSKYFKENGFEEYADDLGPSPQDLIEAAQRLQDQREQDYPIINTDLLIQAINKAQLLTDPQQQADMMGAIGRITTLPEELKEEKFQPIIDGTYSPKDAADDAVKTMQPPTASLRESCRKEFLDYKATENQYNLANPFTSAIVPYAEDHPFAPSSDCARMAAYDSSRKGSGRSFVKWISDELKGNDCGCGCYGEEKFMKKLRGGALKDCPAGYDNQGLTCLERCGPNEIDTGLFCMGPKNCPAGQRDDGTSCWDDLKCETHWNDQCVHWGPVFGRDWWTGCAVTTCNGGPRVQTKQTRAKAIIGRVDWAQTGADLKTAFQDAFGKDSALAKAFDPERNGVAAAFREFGKNTQEAFKKLGSIIRRAVVGLISGATSLVRSVTDFLGGIGATIRGEQSPEELGRQFLGALTAVTTVAGTFVTGGVGGVAIRLLSNALTMLANSKNGHPPTAADFAGLVADIVPGAALGDAVRGAVDTATGLTATETESAAGETFAAASEASMIPRQYSPEEIAEAKQRIEDARKSMQELGVIDFGKINVARKAKEEAQVYCQFNAMAKRLYPDDLDQQKTFADELMQKVFPVRASQVRDAYESSKETPTPKTEEQVINEQLDYFKNIDTINQKDQEDLQKLLDSFKATSEQKYDEKYYSLHKDEVDAEVNAAKEEATKKAQEAIDSHIKNNQSFLKKKLDALAPFQASLPPLIAKAKKDLLAATEKANATKNNSPEQQFLKKYSISPSKFNDMDYDQQQEIIRTIDFYADINGPSTERIPGRNILADLKAFKITPKSPPAGPSSMQEELQPLIDLDGNILDMPVEPQVAAKPEGPRSNLGVLCSEKGRPAGAYVGCPSATPVPGLNLKSVYGTPCPTKAMIASDPSLRDKLIDSPLSTYKGCPLQGLGMRGGAGTKQQLEELGDSIEQAAREGIITKRDKRRLDDIVYTGFAEIRSLPKRTTFQYVTGQRSPAQDAKEAVVERVTADFEAAGAQIRLRGNDAEYGQTFKDFVIYRTFAPELERAMMTRNDINNSLQEHYGFQPRHEMGDWPTDTVSVVNPMARPAELTGSGFWKDNLEERLETLGELFDDAYFDMTGEHIPTRLSVAIKQTHQIRGNQRITDAAYTGNIIPYASYRTKLDLIQGTSTQPRSRFVAPWVGETTRERIAEDKRYVVADTLDAAKEDYIRKLVPILVARFTVTPLEAETRLRAEIAPLPIPDLVLTEVPPPLDVPLVLPRGTMDAVSGEPIRAGDDIIVYENTNGVKTVLKVDAEDFDEYFQGLVNAEAERHDLLEDMRESHEADEDVYGYPDVGELTERVRRRIAAPTNLDESALRAAVEEGHTLEEIVAMGVVGEGRRKKSKKVIKHGRV